MSKHHFCQVKHDPPHSYGDCLRASLACLLDVDDVLDVPHFFHDGCSSETGFDRMKEWLNSRQLHPFFTFFSEDTLEEVTGFMQISNPGVRYILLGRTNNQEHAVVYSGDNIIHDSAWYSSFMVGPQLNGLWAAITVVPAFLVEND